MSGSSGASSLTTAVARGELLRRGVGAGTAVLGVGALLAWRPESAGPAPSRETDREIFQFALQLEYLQAAFYAAAVDAGALRGEVLEFAETVAGHEGEHVEFLRTALGTAAAERPAYDFGSAPRNPRSFLKAAVLLENTGVAAYNGQAANLTRDSLAAAAEIVSVEGRHAAWASALAGEDPAPRAADLGETATAVTATIERTGFVR